LNLLELKRKHTHKNVKRIDITIYENSFWNKGIGAQINSMLLEFGFLKCNVDMIYAITEDYNIRAQKCLLKSGFVLDLILEHYATSKGKSEYCYLINKQEYIGKCTK
jgi:RimJ/RimL family protein N-acetyltransferase